MIHFLLFGPLLPLVGVIAAVWHVVTMKARDEGVVRHEFSRDVGEITQIKLVSLGSPFRQNAPRIYRVVLTLPDGGRMLHRVALQEFRYPERLL